MVTHFHNAGIYHFGNRRGAEKQSGFAEHFNACSMERPPAVSIGSTAETAGAMKLAP